jgi:hypothetical protein
MAARWSSRRNAAGPRLDKRRLPRCFPDSSGRGSRPVKATKASARFRGTRSTELTKLLPMTAPTPSILRKRAQSCLRSGLASISALTFASIRSISVSNRRLNALRSAASPLRPFSERPSAARRRLSVARRLRSRLIARRCGVGGIQGCNFSCSRSTMRAMSCASARSVLRHIPTPLA